MNTSLLLAWAVLSVAAPAQDRVLRNGKPEDVALSRERLEAAARILEEETKSGRILAASLWVARRGVLVLDRGFGKRSPEPSGVPAGPESVYIVASVTKPVAVTSLLLLVERGRVSLSDPVQKYLPEFQGAQKETVRVGAILNRVSNVIQSAVEEGGR